MVELNFKKPILKEYFNITEINNWDGSFSQIDDFYRGRSSIILKPDKVNEWCDLRKLYPKDDITIKIFKNSITACKSAQIQNIFYNYGLAPLIYDIGKYEDFAFQIVKFLKGEYCYDEIQIRNLYGLMKGLLNENYLYQSEDLYPSNVIDGNWIDFGNFDFKDLDKLKSNIAIKYNNLAIWGNSNNAYQSFEELGIKGARGDVRKKMFDLDSFDFTNKTVLALGCSGGYFVNYCKRKGARAIGIDLFNVALVAREASNILGIFSEFYPYDLTKDYFEDFIYRITGIKKFDYVFFLSMDQHIGFKDYLGRIAKTLFFESNGGKPAQEEYDEFKLKLADLFTSVEFKGVSKEGAERNLFICKNE